MDYIWSFEKLAKICRHKKPDPQLFTRALNLLCELYPDKAGDIALNALRNLDMDACKRMTMYYMANPRQTEQQLEELAALYTDSLGLKAGAIAKILASVKYDGLVDLVKNK
ncbi:MAG: hypothetical protein GY765_31320, partial [bacterium]|nr:hypothetical protein [bacterium]